MKRRIGFRVAVALLAAVLLTTGVGCRQWLVLSQTISFGAGWLLRDLTYTTTVERECYQNGVLVDCDTLPENLGQ